MMDQRTQKQNRNRNRNFAVFGFFISVFVFLIPLIAFGQINLNYVSGSTFNLGTTNLLDAAIKIVQWALALVGLVAVIIIIYGGYLWLTAAGRVEQVQKAKRVITQAAIGLIIILLAWAIVSFIVDAIQDATGANQPGYVCTAQDVANNICPTACGRCTIEGQQPTFDGSCPLCPSGGTGFNLAMTWTDPTDGATGIPICRAVQAGFTHPINDTTVNQNTFYLQLPDMNGDPLFPNQSGLPATSSCSENVQCLSGKCESSACVGDRVEGNYWTAGNVIAYKSTVDMEMNARYQVTVVGGNTGVKALNGLELAGDQQWRFDTGNIDDTEPPVVQTVNPVDNEEDVCRNAPLNARFNEPMFAPSFTNNTVLLKDTATNQQINIGNFDFSLGPERMRASVMSTMAANTEYEASLISGDPAVPLGGGVRDACLNPLDGDADGTAEFPDDHSNPSGTDEYAPYPSGAGAGDEPDWRFTTGETDVCTPIITSVTPGNSAYTDSTGPNFNTITLQGNYLYPGTTAAFADAVPFNVGCFNATWVPDPTVCMNAYDDSNSPTELTLGVPSGAITNGAAPNGARTGGLIVNNGVGDSSPFNFTVSNSRIFGLSPKSGPPLQWVSIIADPGGSMGFGTQGANDKVIMRSQSSGYTDEIDVALAPCASGSWTDASITVLIPDNQSVGRYAFQVIKNFGQADQQRSNLVLFDVNTAQVGPGLCPLNNQICANAQRGNPGTSTIADGQQFENNRGTGAVVFTKQGTADTNDIDAYPAWGDAQINFNLDNPIDYADYWVNVRTNGGLLSNAQPFGVPCGAQPQIAFDASCNASGGIFPSPNPYPESTEVCRNLGSVRARFTLDMLDGDLENPANYELRSCDANKQNCVTVAGAIGPNPTIISGPPDEIDIPLANNLTADTWYQFVVRGGVRSFENVPLGNDVTWFFKTRALNEDCTATVLGLGAIDADGANPMYFPSTQTSGHPNNVRYTASPTNDTCQIINPGAVSYTWNSSDASVATCSSAPCNSNMEIMQTALTPPQASGTTTITAQLSGLSAQMLLHVYLNYCQLNSDCPCGANQSVCDQATSTCQPYVTDNNPDFGPDKSAVTIQGCFFGNTPGNVEFVDVIANPDVPYNADLNICGPIVQWTNTLVKVGAPTGPTFGLPASPVNVQSVAYDQSNNQVMLDSTNMGSYEYRNACQDQINGGSVPIPAAGVPILCSLNPSAGPEGQLVTASGLRFSGSAPPNRFTFTGPGATFLNATINGWDLTKIDSTVPATAISGNVFAHVQSGLGYCSSNNEVFGVQCSSNGQCSTGCCIAGLCQESGMCATGQVGQVCAIASNPSCPTGQAPADPAYVCASDTDYVQGKSVVPPPPSSLGDDCRVCCDPDPNEDGVLLDGATPRVSVGGVELVCSAVPAGGGACQSANNDFTPPIESGSKRGLYCGCTDDSQCGTGNGCSSQNDPTGLQCCRPRPTLGANPSQNTMCINRAISFTFTEPMNPATINGTNIRVVRESDNAVLVGSFMTANDTVIFTPTNNLTPGRTYRVEVGANVEDMYGISMGTPAQLLSYVSVNPDADLCNIVDITFGFTDTTGIRWNQPPEIYNCARDTGCTGDAMPASNGNQHRFFAWGVGPGGMLDILTGIEHTASIAYDPFDVVQDIRDSANANPCPNGTVDIDCVVTPNMTNGEAYIQVVADGTGRGINTFTKQAPIDVFLCEHPWPDPRNITNPAYDRFPFSGDASDAYHYSTQYCMDAGLPEMRIGSVLNPAVNSPLHIGGAPSIPGVDERLDEYDFFMTDPAGNRVGKDQISVLIMENELNLPPDLWYRRALPNEPQNGQMLTVNGFEAYRVGRTTYISGVSINRNLLAVDACDGPGSICEGGHMDGIIMIIAYSDGATPQTVSVYNEVLNNLRFVTNSATEGISVDENLALRRDVLRVHDLFRLSILLSDYRKLNGTYPLMPAGTYLPNISTSKWPSWSNELGRLLRSSLPEDPVNTFATCPAGYDQNTCWNETEKSFQVPVPSYLYQYSSYVNGTTVLASVFARLEYNDLGSWRTILNENNPINACDPALNSDWNPAAPPPGGTCADYTFEWGSGEFEQLVSDYQTEGAIDNDEPTNVVLTVPNPITDTVNVTVTATDAGVGIDRVELFVDDELYATQTAGTPAYTFSFNPSHYINGPHDFHVRVIDRSGNVADPNSSCAAACGPVTVQINYAGGDDAEAPILSDFIAGNSTTTQHLDDGVRTVETGSLFFGDYWSGTESSVDRCTDDLSSCITIHTVPGVGLYWHVGADKQNSDRFLASYTPAPASRQIQVYSKTAPANSAPIETYGVYYLTNAVRAPNGSLIAVDEFKNIRVYRNYVNGDNLLTGGGEMPNRVYARILDIGSGNPDLSIQGIDVDTSGNVYVSIRDGGNIDMGIIRKLNSQLATVRQFTGIYDPQGLHWDNGKVYVASLDGTISILDENLNGIQDSYGGFANPTDVAVKDGYLYVAENAHAIIRYPMSAEVSGSAVPVSVVANDSGSGIDRVEFYIDTTYIGTGTLSAGRYGIIWDSMTIDDGTYDLYAVAFDMLGNSSIMKRVVSLHNGRDTVPPTLSFVRPLNNGDDVSGMTQVLVNATDNEGIRDVLFEIRDQNGTWEVWDRDVAQYPNPDAGSPYSWVWDTNADGNGTGLPPIASVELRFTATDVNGNQTVRTITVDVDNSVPGVPSAWFINPESNDYFAPGYFEIYATDTDGTISEVRLLNRQTSEVIDTQITATNSIYRMVWPYDSSRDGVYDFSTIAIDNDNKSSDPNRPGAWVVQVRIDTVAPSITSFTPATGPISGTVQFVSQSNDNSGNIQSGIDKVEYYVFTMSPWNLRQVGVCDPANLDFGNFQCSVSVNTGDGSFPDNTYWLIAAAYDGAGNATTLIRQNIQFQNGTGDTTPPTMTGLSVNPSVTIGATSYTRNAPTVNDPAVITASATDLAGVTWMNVRINGTVVDQNGNATGGHTCNASPCTVNWDTRTIPDGTNVTIDATAGDPSNNISTPRTLQIVVDNSAPAFAGIVNDLVEQSDDASVYATWPAATDPHSPVRYTYAIGTATYPNAGWDSVTGWVGTPISNTYVYHNAAGQLTQGATYYFSLKALNGANAESGVIVSDGFQYCASSCDSQQPADPQFTFIPQYQSGPTYFTTSTIRVVSADVGSAGIDHINIYVNGVIIDSNADGMTCSESELIGSADTCEVPWNPPTETTYTVSAQSTDNASNASNTISVTAQEDRSGPTGTITTPQNNFYVSGNVAISTTTPTDGTGSGIQRIEFYAGSTLIGTDTAPSWYIYWSTTAGNPPDGDYVLTMRMYDNLGNMTTSPGITVHLNNGSIPGNVCGPNMCVTPTSSCCTPSYQCYNSSTTGCCNGVLYNRTTQQCCGGVVRSITYTCIIVNPSELPSAESPAPAL